ncbi:MarR family transcriptional regulator [Chryseobacterium sp. MYb264]|uniref:MarR family winged helix-turn-helix transcriptional regulator n=1 Tax=Chryseobacterium sp. MYb264 TaxID=2745153 RepID=UPI002E0D4518|nr:MarR family transcriptional regulator [Chryseobacterium sp. MYb264]
MVKEKDNTDELALSLGFAMTEMKTRLRQKIQEKINEYDASFSYEMLEILGLIWRGNDGINQQEIAKRISKDKSSVTYLINNLVHRGLVVRTEDHTDRRNKKIYLTEKGSEVMGRVYPWILELYKQAAGDARKSDIKKAFDLIKKMTNNLEQL